MPLDLLHAWLMVLLRSLGVVLMLPTLAGRPLPTTLRVALGACLATLLYGIVPRAGMLPQTSGGLIGAAAGEVILGLVFGFIGRLCFSAIEMAGRVASGEVGLAAAPGFDVPIPAQEPLPALFSAFAGVLFFSVGAHLGVIAAFARSFDYAPAGQAAFNRGALDFLVTDTARAIELGFRIAAPFIAMNFLISLAFSVLGRAVPKMNVFIVSISLRVIIGFTLLASGGTLIAAYFLDDVRELPLRMLEVLPPR
jgi:flagellar biosynthesis protein FliR